MMSRWYTFFIGLTLLALPGYGQQKKDTLYRTTDQRTKRPDTCHYVYIERDRNARCYRMLEDISDIDELLKSYLHDHKQKQRPAIKGFSKDWCHINSLYKGELFLYAPCDWYTFDVVSFRGGITLSGPRSDLGVDTNNVVTKVSSQLYTVKLSEPEPYDIPLMLDIHMIDTVNKVAVFEYHYKNNKREYDLMIDVQHVRAFPVIVNHCACSKAREYHMPDDGRYIDFPESIKQGRVVIGKK